MTNGQLVPPNKVLLPPLHFKLGLTNQFVKSFDNESSALQYLHTKFPKLSFEKFVLVFLLAYKLKKIQSDSYFDSILSIKEKGAWKSYKIWTNCGNFSEEQGEKMH